MAKYLSDIDFSSEETEDSLGAHLAYTFESQGGAASGYNTALAFKANGKPTPSKDAIKALAELGEDVTQLTKSYMSQISSLVSEKLDEKYSIDWNWVYLVDIDFDNSIVIFATDDGLYSTTFEINDLLVTIADTATPVVRVTEYQVVDGEILVSVDFFDKLVDEALQSLVQKSFKTETVKEFLIKAKGVDKGKNSVIAEDTLAVTKNAPANTNEIIKGEKPLENINLEELLKSADIQDLITKAVSEQVSVIKESADAEILKANNALEELKKAQEKRIEEDYTIVVKSFEFVEEANVEKIVKALMADSEVADLIVKTFEKAGETITNLRDEFTKEHGSDAEGVEVAKSASELVTQRAAAIKAARKN